MRARSPAEEPGLELNMTPMIDVVFQLLIFFMFTLKPVIHEHQFVVTLSTTSVAEAPEELLLPPLAVYLRADARGALASIALGDNPIRDFDELRVRCQSLAGGTFGAEVEAEIYTDDALQYQYLIEAVNALTAANISNINFAPGE